MMEDIIFYDRPSYVEDHAASEWVEMTELEIDGAIWTGTQIWRKSHADGRNDRNGWRGFTEGENPGQRHQCLGALAERIAAKSLSIYWPSACDNFGDADLAYNVEVKLIGAAHYGLRVYPRTHDSRRVIGVVIPKGTERDLRYRVAGWYVAGEAKRQDWAMAPHGLPPMYCVPQAALRRVAELREMIAQEMLSKEYA